MYQHRTIPKKQLNLTMKPTTYTTGIYSPSVSLLKLALLLSQGKVQQNKSHKQFSYLKSKSMKTILTAVLALFIQVSAFSQLSSFSAILNTGKVHLEWLAIVQKNISHFSIEKSTDGKNYSQAGIVFTFTNAPETMNYPFNDKNVNTNKTGVIYYRISAVDINGKTESLEVKAIRIGKENEQEMSILNLSKRDNDKI